VTAAEVRERGLEELANEVRRHHKAVERHARGMLAEAIAAGEKLLETKARLPHGEFGAFKAYCEVSRSSASDYLRLAREKPRAGVLGADSIRGALRALGGEPKKEPIPKAWDWFFKSRGTPGASRDWPLSDPPPATPTRSPSGWPSGSSASS
jgi:Protein of unknown function (DUF3102)